MATGKSCAAASVSAPVWGAFAGAEDHGVAAGGAQLGEDRAERALAVVDGVVIADVAGDEEVAQIGEGAQDAVFDRLVIGGPGGGQHDADADARACQRERRTVRPVPKLTRRLEDLRTPLLADAGLAVKRLVDRRQRNAQRRGDVLDRCPFHSRFGFRLPFLYCIYYNGKRGTCQ